MVGANFFKIQLLPHRTAEFRYDVVAILRKYITRGTHPQPAHSAALDSGVELLGRQASANSPPSANAQLVFDPHFSLLNAWRHCQRVLWRSGCDEYDIDMRVVRLMFRCDEYDIDMRVVRFSLLNAWV